MPLPHEPPVESPQTLDEAYAFLADGRAWRPLAGGTDLMVELASGRGAPPERVLDLWRIRELRGIWLEPRALVLGALTTYTDLRRSALATEIVPALVEAATSVGAAQIQNRGTLGGNLATASPAGDMLPVLLALDAEVVLGGPRGERAVPIDGFFVGYRQTDVAPDELIVRLRVPIVPGREVRFRKVGTRRAQAISKVSLALAWRDGTDEERRQRAWLGVRVALGRCRADPGSWRGGGARGSFADTRDRRPGGRDAGRRAAADRRRPLDGRVPADGRGEVAASARARGGRLVIVEPA
jgi:CO/xanthine dehydrogenase FAD-binding subunit